MDKENTVRQSGGFIIQLMPFADEKVVALLEEKISKITSVTSMLEEGMTPEDILTDVLGDFDVQFVDTIPTGFNCNCSKERVEKVLFSLGRKELNDMINDGEDIELNCHFCNKKYNFTIDDIKKMIK